METLKIPTATLKQADKMIDSAIKMTMEAIVELEFTFQCKHCDEIHHANLPPVVAAALLRANLNHLLRGTALSDMERQGLELYTSIIAHLYKDNLANAELLQDEMIEMMSKHDDNPDNGMFITLELKKWSEHG